MSQNSCGYDICFVLLQLLKSIITSFSTDVWDIVQASEVYLGPCQTYMKKLYTKIVNSWKPLPVSTKRSTSDVWQCTKYASDFLSCDSVFSFTKESNSHFTGGMKIAVFYCKYQTLGIARRLFRLKGLTFSRPSITFYDPSYFFCPIFTFS